MRHTVSLLATLAVLWLLLSGHYTPLLLALGAASCIAVAVLAHRMRTVDAETQPLHMAWYLPGYWLWLAGAITRANLDVSLLILRPNMPVSPTILQLQPQQKTELGQVIYANSITLTPGTVAVDLHAGKIDVHALTQAAAQELQSGAMDRRVQTVEQRAGLGGAP